MFIKIIGFFQCWNKVVKITLQKNSIFQNIQPWKPQKKWQKLPLVQCPKANMEKKKSKRKLIKSFFENFLISNLVGYTQKFHK